MSARNSGDSSDWLRKAEVSAMQALNSFLFTGKTSPSAVWTLMMCFPELPAGLRLQAWTVRHQLHRH